MTTLLHERMTTLSRCVTCSNAAWCWIAGQDIVIYTGCPGYSRVRPALPEPTCGHEDVVLVAIGEHEVAHCRQCGKEFWG